MLLLCLTGLPLIFHHELGHWLGTEMQAPPLPAGVAARAVTLDEAVAHVQELFQGYELDFVDLSPAARPGLDTPLAASLIAAVGQEPQPKYGWTDVARLSEIGIPAVNFGPGDALLAHTDNEHVRFSELNRCYSELRSWLMSD